VGLQLLEAQNVWGVIFPPDDWSVEAREEAAPAPDYPPASERADAVSPETRVSSLAGEEITIRLLQELQESADAHVREFQDRLNQLTQRLGLELEFDMRERATQTNAREISTLEEEIKVLREGLSAAKEKIEKLEAKIQELQGGLHAATENPPPPPAPLPEAQRQLTALAKSVVESMNRAAEAGLNEYRTLLQKENQESAARLRAGAKKSSPPPAG
jgi:chromosome segregation ATPase